MHITVNRPQRINTSLIWREKRRNGRERGTVEACREERGQTWTEFSGAMNCIPSEIELAELVAQPCSIMCTANQNKKLSYGWETVRRESMPRIAEMDVEMTT